ncbi:ribonuclease H [Pseudoflavonifractor phocaeensis]|uniref:ribonuclease H family protein n=1 Tax=Pseudoflavonifractor phocaeensis TaxID=1870988 RepID=UPI002FF51522
MPYIPMPKRQGLYGTFGNPGPGGWGCVIIIDGKEQELSGGHISATNNRMELMGVISGLKALRGPHIVKVYSDSQYVTNAFNKGWLKSWRAHGWARSGGELKNVELWKELDSLTRKHSVQFIWVKGHVGNYYNEVCDRLATKQSKRYEEIAGRDPAASIDAGEDQSPKAGWVNELNCMDVLGAFEHFIRSQHVASDGIPAPCGAKGYCDYCGDDDPDHRCSMAYIAWLSAHRFG